jgi:hypothetical protein
VPSWGIPLYQEIELKDKVFDIMWGRRVRPNQYAITPMMILYGKSSDIRDKDKAYEL